MTKFVIKRIATGMIALLFLITITFFLIRFMPGNPFDTGNVSDEILHIIEDEYGLNEPLFQQYTSYMKQLAQGEFGMSMKKPGVSVNDLIARCVPITLTIGGLSFALALLMGIAMGIGQVLTNNKYVASVFVTIQNIGIGIPNFVVAIVLILVFGVYLKWFPIVGITQASNYVLPVITLSLYPACVIARMIYTAVEREKKQSYIILFEARGVPKWKLICVHMRKSILYQILVYLSQLLAYLLTGSFVVESIFSIPGLGREFVYSIGNRDYTVILGLTIFMGIIVIITQVVLDIIQIYLDPRIRFEMEQEL